MRALLLAVLVVLAGCGAAGPTGSPSPTDPASSTDSASPTDSGTPTQTSVLTGPCEVEDRPTPDASGSDVAPIDYPDRPEFSSAEAVRSYVESFEESYRRNDVLADRGNVTYLETYVGEANVTRHGDAYVVRLNSYTNGGYRDTGAGTPITIHWDGAPEPVAYLLTEDRLIRGEFSRETTPSLSRLRHHPTVACF